MNQVVETNQVVEPDLSLGIGNICDVTTAEIEILNPQTQEGTGLFLTLAGPEHPLRKAAVAAAIREARSSVARRMSSAGRVMPHFKDPEEEEQEGRQELVAATLGWRSTKVALPPFTKEGIAALYADPSRQWLVRQVQARINEQTLFIKA